LLVVETARDPPDAEVIFEVQPKDVADNRAFDRNDDEAPPHPHAISERGPAEDLASYRLLAHGRFDALPNAAIAPVSGPDPQ
jgi:hypothetical protein